MDFISQKYLKDLHNKTCLMRVDFNVPLRKEKNKQIVVDDNSKMKLVLPSIKNLQKKGAGIVLLSHLGRPQGRRKKSLSMEPVFEELKKIMPEAKKQIKFVSSWNLKDIKQTVTSMKDGDILLLNNLRFKKGEEENDSKFAKQLASLGRLYINDAFAVCHRRHASVVEITKYLPSYAGLLLEKEMQAMEKLIKKPVKPFVVMMGGVKISTKIGAIKNLFEKANYILVGGALANVFFKAKGMEIGKSVYEKKEVAKVKNFLNKRKIILPVDVVVSTKEDKVEIKTIKQIKKTDSIMDVGPETIAKFSQYIRKAKTIAWNGPLGRFEEKQFSHGSIALGKLIASRASGRAFGVAGGGETLEVIKMTKMGKFFDHLSSGGGAMIAYLEGKKLPGIEALKII